MRALEWSGYSIVDVLGTLAEIATANAVAERLKVETRNGQTLIAVEPSVLCGQKALGR